VRSRGGRARRPRPPLPLDPRRLLGRLLRGRGSGSSPLLLRLGNGRSSGRLVPAAGGGDRGGAGRGGAAVHAAHGGVELTGGGAWTGRGAKDVSSEKAAIRRRRRVGRAVRGVK
jgi:hypothetical protein